MTFRFLHSVRLMLPVLVTIAVFPSLLALLYSGLTARDKALNAAEQEILHKVNSMAVIQERITASTQVMLSSLTRVASVTKLDLPACNELFGEIIKLNPIYTNILMTDSSGNIIAAAVPSPPINLADRKHFKEAYLARKFSTGEYIVSRTTSEPAFPFTYPLLDEQGQVQAILIASVELKQYKEFYAEESLPEGSFYGIADHAGLRLFRIPILDHVFDLGKPISPSVWNFLKTGHKNGVMHQDGSDKVRRIIAYRRLDLGPGTPPYMYMFVGIPEKILAQKASSAMFTNAMLAGFSWLFALFLAWLIGRNLFFKNIKKLADSASRFGTGYLNKSTGVDHQAGELGRVAEAFDQMADKLWRTDQERDNLQAQLIQAQKLESVGRLAGGVAHDFNNMLMVIIGHTEMLLGKFSTKDPNRSSLENILNAANKSANLTRQLMAFARKQTISPVILDLNNTIIGMITMLQRLIGENIQVIWIPDKALWPIKVDPAQIDQILVNLTVNARDAIENSGNITIKTANVTIDATYCTDHLESAPGDYVMLSVCDDGSGIDKETQLRLFEPFFTTKGLGKGTGLGLATIYGIVKQNNGFINVYSELGKGTCFKIYFPSYTGEMPRESEALQTEIPKGHGELILLVEDEISILNLGKLMLEQLGYQVIAAASPEEMLSNLALLPCPAKLLITDVVMPKMNGRELANRIMKLHPEIKSIFMSGYTSKIIAHQGVLDEHVNFIEKPFTLKTLATTVRKVLDFP